jgi:glucose/arabinose dehydrogenase
MPATCPRALHHAVALFLALPLLAAAPLPEPAGDFFPVAGGLAGVALQRQLAAAGLDEPVAIAHAGDDRLFVTLRAGQIRVLDRNGRPLPRPLLDIRPLVGTVGEGGLLSAAFHPRFADNGLFFIDYTDRAGNTVIARYRVAADNPNLADPASRKVLLTIDQPFSNHNGGQLQFGPDGYLYIGMGDGGAAGDPACRAQRDDTLLGKLLRLDVDANSGAPPYYGIPAGNPAGDAVWARGLRNPWRFSFDRATGDLWIGDVGQNEREEIDFQPAGDRGGENYGWKVMEGTACFGLDACPASTPTCNSTALTLPVLEYGHDRGCAVTGGYVYRGNQLPALRGSYVFGDYCSGIIWAAKRQGTGFEVRQLADAVAGGLVTFGEDHAGELWVGAQDGGLYRLGARRPPAGVGLYEPAAARFHLKDAATAGPEDRAVRFGRGGNPWIPLAGDWNGDGRDTIGFYDPATATFRLKNSLAGPFADLLFTLGERGNRWIPVIGDWDGNGKDGVGFYDPATATFHLKNAAAAGPFDLTFAFGPPGNGWVPVAGDWDGDGRDGIGLYDPETSTFRLKNSAARGPVDIVLVLTAASGAPQLPVAGDWDGDGVDTVGLYDPARGTFQLAGRSGTTIATTFALGPAGGGWRPLAGRW